MFEKIRGIIAGQLNIEEGTVKEDSTFADLGADSLDLFELVMSLEEEYGIEIPSEDLEGLLSVSDVIKYLSDKGVE